MSDEAAGIKQHSMLAPALIAIFSLVGSTPTLSLQVAGPSLYDAPWIWTEDSGRNVVLSDWKGQLLFLSMAYSHCHNTCAMTFHTLDRLQRDLDRKGNTAQIVVVSYDPANDTPAAWTAFRRGQHRNRANWHFLSGSRQATRALASALGLADFWTADSHVLHNFGIAQLDADGRIARNLEWNDTLRELQP